jgi:hypothetical protein
MASNTETAITKVIVDGQMAEDELQRLQKESDKLRKKLTEAMRANNHKEITRLKKELRGVSKEMKGLEKATFDTDRVLKNLSGATLNELYKTKRKISRELGNMTRGTKEYRNATKQLRAVEGEIGKVRNEMGRTRKMAISLKSALSFFGIAGLITGVVAGVGRLIKSLPGLSMEMEGDARKAAVVFGDSLGYVEEQAANLANKLGVTNREFVAMAANTADLLIPLDFSRRQAAEMSTELQGLSGALSEWTGGKIEVAEVSEILTKAMLGENEQLKQLGIAIRKDTEEFRDLRDELMKSEKMTLAQAEAMATLELITKKSTDAQASFNQEGNKLQRWWRNAKRVFREWKESVVDYFSIDASEKLKQERVEMNNLFEAAKNTAEGTKARKDAIDLINQKYGKYLDNLLTEKSTIEDIKTAQEDANAELVKSIALKEQEEIVSDYKDKQSKQVQRIIKSAEKGLEDLAAIEFGDMVEQAITAYEKGTTKGDSEAMTIINAFAERFGISEFQQRNIREYIDLEKKKQKELLESARVNAAILNVNPEDLNFFGTSKGANTDEDPDPEGPDYETMLSDLESFNQERTLLIKEYYSEEKITREQYQRELYKQEMSYLQAKKALHEKMGEETFDLEMQILEKQVQAQEQIDEWRKKDLETEGPDEIADQLMTKLEKELQIELKFIDKEIQAQEAKAAKIEKIEQGVTKEQQTKYQKRLDNTMRVAEVAGDILGKQIAEGKMSLEDFGKAILLSGLKTMRGILHQAIFEATVKSIAQPDSTASFGVTGLIRAGILTGLMHAAFSVLEAKLQFAGGRYPVRGPIDGKTYNAAYVGSPSTGIYTQPSLGLFSEQMPEMVIDGPTTRNLQVNYPGVIDSIMAARQFAGGQYNIPGDTTERREIREAQTANRESQALIAVLSTLNETLQQGVEAKFDYRTTRDIRDRIKDIEDIEQGASGY